jgi:hypothetical protein
MGMPWQVASGASPTPPGLMQQAQHPQQAQAQANVVGRPSSLNCHPSVASCTARLAHGAASQNCETPRLATPTSQGVRCQPTREKPGGLH